MPAKRYESIDEYIRGFPTNTREVLEGLRRVIRQAAPEAAEAISYQMPTFKLAGRSLVHFAGYAKHIGLYPLPSGIEAFKEELEPYAQGKGSIRFPLDRPIPYDLVGRIAAFRAQEILKDTRKGR